MEITGVETALVPGQDAPDPRHHCFLWVETDAGVTGVGEATAPGVERGVEAAVRDHARHLLGRDPRRVRPLVDRMETASAWNAGAIGSTARSGLEMALWDILGKHLDARVCDLLGGAARERLPLYANGVVPKDGAAAEQAEAAAAAVDRGYDALKFVPTYEDGERAWLTRQRRERAVDRVRAVSEAIPDDVELALEFHGNLAPEPAVQLARAVAEFDPLWVEEPVPPDNLDALRRIRDRLPVPVATGERLLGTQDYRDLFQHPVPTDIVQPDVSNCGGITHLRNVAEMAAAEYVALAPHNSRGPVATAAAAHVCATVPNFLVLEYFPDWPPWRQDLLVGSERVADGRYHLPDGPGLGVELDRETVAEFAYERPDAATGGYTEGYRDVWE